MVLPGWSLGRQPLRRLLRLQRRRQKISPVVMDCSQRVIQANFHLAWVAPASSCTRRSLGRLPPPLLQLLMLPLLRLLHADWLVPFARARTPPSLQARRQHLNARHPLCPSGRLPGLPCLGATKRLPRGPFPRDLERTLPSRR
ncbi:unnamed protein product [Ectocarpus sp. 13 AM-2016]